MTKAITPPRPLSVLLALSLLLAGPAIAQNGEQERIADFNQDGVVDTLRSFYEGGSGFGGNTATVVHGKTGDTFALTTYGCFCQIRRTIPIPQRLGLEENAPFLEAIQEAILPEERTTPDASLAWIIASSFSHAALPDHPFFDLVIDPGVPWQHGRVECPDAYYMEMARDTLQQVLAVEEVAEEGIGEPEEAVDGGFLIYYAHNHYTWGRRDSLIGVAQNDEYTVLRTAHGLVAQQGEQHKWVFISDYFLTGAPSKLRWPSMGSVTLVGKYLFLQQNLPVGEDHRVWVINLESGLCGRLKPAGEATIEGDSIEIGEATVILGSHEGAVAYRHTEIFEALEKLYLRSSE